jgi:hypothetical protein
MQAVVRGLGTLRRVGQTAGPYLMLELLLPGGTLLALLLFLYRRRRLGTANIMSNTAMAVTRALAGMAGQGIFVERSRGLGLALPFLPAYATRAVAVGRPERPPRGSVPMSNLAFHHNQE